MEIDSKFSACGELPACPAAYQTDTAKVIMQGSKVDPASQPGVVVPAHEVLNVITPDVVDELRRQPFMNIAQLGEWIMDNYSHGVFRLETLSRYRVGGSDEANFQRYVAGEAGPDRAGKQAWLDVLADAHDRGCTWRNLHVIDSREMADYVRFELEWCYPDTAAAGAEIRIFDRAEADFPDDLLDLDDYYLVDDQAAVLGYAKDGTYLYALPVKHPSRLFAARDRLWDAAVPFAEWWARHPEHHRAHRRAA